MHYVVVDLETTGFSPERGDAIVEIGAVRVRDNQITDTFQTLVDPERTIPYGVQRVHGISDAMVKGAPTIAEALPAFMAFAQDACLVSHNARFDRSFLDHFHRQVLEGPLPLPHLDTVRISRRLLTHLPNHKLDTLIRSFNIKIDDRHRALGDAQATAEILIQLLPQAETILPQCML